MKIKKIATGNGYTSRACRNGEYDTDKEYLSVIDLLKAATPKYWKVTDWRLIDTNKYQLGNTSTYVEVEE